MLALSLTGAACGGRRPDLWNIDAQLTHDLLHAFVPGHIRFAEYGAAIVPGESTVEEFTRRAREVPGWDRIVMIGAYADGRVVRDDPLLEGIGPALLEEIEAVEGVPNDEFCEVLVLRDGAIVGELRLLMEGHYPTGFVVAATP